MLFMLLISREEVGKGHHSAQASEGLKWVLMLGVRSLTLGLVAPSHHLSLSGRTWLFSYHCLLKYLKTLVAKQHSINWVQIVLFLLLFSQGEGWEGGKQSPQKTITKLLIIFFILSWSFATWSWTRKKKKKSLGYFGNRWDMDSTG